MDIHKARRLAGLPLKESASTTTDVIPDNPQIAEDVAQEIANRLFVEAEKQAANISHDENGHGFDGNAIMAEAQKILQRVMTYLDDKIKQGK